jgi:hypothetical protein
MIFDKLRRELTRPRHLAMPSKHDLVHAGEHYAHMAYLGLVGIESSYWYGKVALIGLFFAAASLFIKESGHAALD